MDAIEVIPAVNPVQLTRAEVEPLAEERGLVLLSRKQLEGVRNLGELVHQFGTVSTADGYVVMTQEAVSRMLMALTEHLEGGKCKTTDELNAAARTVAQLAKAMVSCSTTLKGSQTHEDSKQKRATFPAGARVLFQNCQFTNDPPGKAK